MRKPKKKVVLKKIGKVFLFHVKIGSREFKIDLAERILKMRNNGGWELPEGSKFKLGEDGIIVKRDTKKTESTSE